MEDKKGKGVSRRDFLKGLGGSSSASAVRLGTPYQCNR